MLDPVLRDGLNRQITAERNNAAFYQAVGVRFELLNLPGAASFAYAASIEESTHAQKIIDYLIDRNETPVIAATDAPLLPVSSEMISVGYVLFNLALQREQQTTQQINTLYLLALEVKDPQSATFLEWFIAEQTRSEREYTALTARFNFAQGCPAAVLQLDHELGEG